MNTVNYVWKILKAQKGSQLSKVFGNAEFGPETTKILDNQARILAYNKEALQQAKSGINWMDSANIYKKQYDTNQRFIQQTRDNGLQVPQNAINRQNALLDKIMNFKQNILEQKRMASKFPNVQQPQYEPWLKDLNIPGRPMYQQGGKIDTTGYYNRSVDLMNQYNNLNFVQRATNGNKMSMQNPHNPNERMTHRMSYMGTDEGYLAYPEVVQIGNKLQYMPNKQGMEYAFKNHQAIPLGNDKNFAEYFTSVGYKYKFPTEDYNAAMQEYSKNKHFK